MEKYRAVPVQIEGSNYDTKEFEAPSDIAAAAVVGQMAGPVTVDLEKFVNGAWAHVANIPGKLPPPAEELNVVNPLKTLTIQH